MTKNTLNTLLLAGAILLAPLQHSKAQETVELGLLECYVDGGTGFILGSVKDISCVFTPVGEPETEDNYFGVISKLGLDIGSTEQAYISWLVIAPNAQGYRRGFLAGDYIGATASATFTIGLGRMFSSAVRPKVLRSSH